MRKTTLVLNSIIVIFFTCFLAYTFYGQVHLETIARDFVTEKTLHYSKTVVKVASVALDSPMAKKFISFEQENIIRQQISDYHIDPKAYITDLTRSHVQDVTIDNTNPLIKKVTSFKNDIRMFYDNTLNAMIVDLRIFSVSNLVAGLIAFILAFRSSSKVSKPIIWFSFMMFVSVLFCSYLYVDDLTFFDILFRLHLGWWYAVLLCLVTVRLFMDYGHHKNTSE